MLILEQLKEKKNFSYNEKLIADYILKETYKVLSMSAAMLAKETYTSPAAIIRLCKRIGLSGYQEFKILLSAQLEQQSHNLSGIDANIPFESTDDIREISLKLEKLTAESLHTARAMIFSMEKEFTNAAALLMKAKHVIIIGVGDAYMSGLAFQARMIRAGFSSYMTTPVYGEQHHLSQTMNSDDCALVLSYSGVTASTIECAQILKERNVPAVALTSSRSSSLCELADIVIYLPDKEKKFRRYANFSSHACMEYYLNVLYSYIFLRQYEDITAVRID